MARARTGAGSFHFANLFIPHSRVRDLIFNKNKKPSAPYYWHTKGEGVGTHPGSMEFCGGQPMTSMAAGSGTWWFGAGTQ